MDKAGGRFMKLKRLFSGESYKGTYHYLDSQKKYEIARTVLFFAISLILFFAGWITTKTKMNLLTIVAVLGCLPASKSAVGMIMYLKYHSCSKAAAEEIAKNSENLEGLYDLVFTSYQKNYVISHLTVKGKTICGYTEDCNFDEPAFYKHIEMILKNDGFYNITVKIFTNLKKYTDRLQQMKTLENDTSCTNGILSTLKNVSL